MTFATCPSCHRFARHLGPMWAPLFLGEPELWEHWTCLSCGSTRIRTGRSSHSIDVARFLSAGRAA